jgi:hypothetical protein
VALTPPELVLSSRIEGPHSIVVGYGSDEQGHTGSGKTEYLILAMQPVDVSGRAVILILIMLGAISTLVFTTRALVINRVEPDNLASGRFFQALQIRDLTSVLQPVDSPVDEDESELLRAVPGKHEHYLSLTLQRMYHATVAGITNILQENTSGRGQLTIYQPSAIDSIRSAMNISSREKPAN